MRVGTRLRTSRIIRKRAKKEKAFGKKLITGSGFGEIIEGRPGGKEGKEEKNTTALGRKGEGGNPPCRRCTWGVSRISGHEGGDLGNGGRKSPQGGRGNRSLRKEGFPSKGKINTPKEKRSNRY